MGGLGMLKRLLFTDSHSYSATVLVVLSLMSYLLAQMAGYGRIYSHLKSPKEWPWCWLWLRGSSLAAKAQATTGSHRTAADVAVCPLICLSVLDMSVCLSTLAVHCSTTMFFSGSLHSQTHCLVRGRQVMWTGLGWLGAVGYCLHLLSLLAIYDYGGTTRLVGL